ncbi:4-nitrophenylphosphatase protein [Rutstroemia sp. NJR-2017a BBW]|nr:4-nitrophenylphosphatase protein [Rutstroemia sp. NJR-2017a BBW]
MTAPKYLTGDQSAIHEFIDKFDSYREENGSRRDNADFYSFAHFRSFCLIAMSAADRWSGVLWSGDHLFPGTVETLEMLRSKGKKTVFVTNNSTKSRAEYQKKLTALGIPSNVDEIFASAYSSAIYISRILKLPAPKNKVFVLGESGIEVELKTEGVEFIGGTDPAYRRDITPEDYKGIADGSLLDDDVGVVLAGLDFHINYLKLCHAYHYLRRGAVFLATNTDSTLPSNHTFFPGAGTISVPLINMIGKQPTALGKPSQAMMDSIEGKFQFDRKRTCMVGDRLETDIKFGIEGKLGGTLAVLTGVSGKDEWEVENAPVVPAYYVDKLSDLRG